MKIESVEHVAINCYKVAIQRRMQKIIFFLTMKREGGGKKNSNPAKLETKKKMASSAWPASAWFLVVILMIHMGMLIEYGGETEVRASLKSKQSPLDNSHDATLVFTCCAIMGYLVWIRACVTHVHVHGAGMFQSMATGVSLFAFVLALTNETIVVCETASCLPRTPLQLVASLYFLILALLCVATIVALGGWMCFSDFFIRAASISSSSSSPSYHAIDVLNKEEASP